jgi:thiol:disulfide interchange protein DsbG
LQSSDPAAALERHERDFDRGGIAPKATLGATSETISANEQLMGDLHIVGTPGLVYRDEHEALRVFSGMPDAQQLEAIVGKR